MALWRAEITMKNKETHLPITDFSIQAKYRIVNQHWEASPLSIYDNRIKNRLTPCKVELVW